MYRAHPRSRARSSASTTSPRWSSASEQLWSWIRSTWSVDRRRRLRSMLANSGGGRHTARGAAPAAGMAALGEQVHVPATGAEGLADQALAVLVALRGVDDVEAAVDGAG